VKRMFSMLALGFFGLGFAAPQLSPQGIIVNPVPSDLTVRTWVDKDPNKTGNPAYQPGENIRISVQVNQDAYVYLFSVKSNGDIGPILPNAFDRDNLIRANEVRTFPPASARYNFTVDLPEGQDRVLAVASKRPLSIDQVVDIQSGRSRVQGADNLARALSIIVTPVPDQDWVSNVAFFIVGRATPPPPATGNLNISSNPQGAQVTVNGRAVGNTPLNLSLQPGRYDIELRLGGYETFRTSVNVNAGQTTPLNVNLSSTAPQTGLLQVSSSPQGAQVTLNGRAVGNTPLNLSVQPGSYNLEVRLGGYETYRTTVNVGAGQTVQVNANLVTERRTGDLVITSIPDNADVYVNGQRAGVTPLRVSLNEGSYDIRIAKDGYSEYRASVQVRRGDTTRVEARLLPQRAVLEVFTNVDARIFVDGREVGSTQNGFLRIEVDARNNDRIQVVAIAPGYRVAAQDTRIDSGRTQQVRLNLSRAR